MRNHSSLLALFLAASLVGCGDAHDHGHAHAHPHDHATGQAHVHTAPHGGALVVLGDEAAHVEFVLDAASGELVAYVLDGEAERSLRLAASALTLTVAPDEGEPFRIELAPVASDLTGETVGDTSEFRGTHPGLVGQTTFAARLAELTLRGVAFPPTDFRYPEGNE
ncbi:MAG: hypothetical protein WD226_09240 [Planctomycetota bacterium]